MRKSTRRVLVVLSAYAEIAPNVFQVPGVPDTVHTLPMNPDAAGAIVI